MRTRTTTPSPKTTAITTTFVAQPGCDNLNHNRSLEHNNDHNHSLNPHHTLPQVKAMRFPPKSYNKELESAEDRREREAQVGALPLFYLFFSSLVLLFFSSLVLLISSSLFNSFSSQFPLLFPSPPSPPSAGPGAGQGDG